MELEVICIFLGRIMKYVTTYPEHLAQQQTSSTYFSTKQTTGFSKHVLILFTMFAREPIKAYGMFEKVKRLVITIIIIDNVLYFQNNWFRNCFWQNVSIKLSKIRRCSIVLAVRDICKFKLLSTIFLGDDIFFWDI